MGLEEITLSQIISLVGGIAGLVSLVVLITKYLLERPNLKFVVEDAYYNQPQPSDSANFSQFYIGLRIENTGRRNTTVHSFVLTFNYKEKSYSPPLMDGRMEVIINADDVKRQILIFGLQKRQFIIPEGNIDNATLDISHTFGKAKTINILTIAQQH